MAPVTPAVAATPPPSTAAGASAAATNSASKKKSTPKNRKRKASDASASKTGASPAKKPSARVGDAAAVAQAGDANAASTTVKPFVRGELTESIKHMMFGFGDDWEPLDESAELMEDLVVEYVHAMTKKAMDMSVIKGKLDTECFIFLIRKDPERYERIKELLRANDEFRAALNSGFDPSDEKMY
ncbi:TPA: hypothetical protein N0F65_011415 [Lagenidium giganteum]|uniref:Transcription initiation factor TFIID subunit 13 n=1 Tax=Lagenidium giganteum TaxID=4803 RepID=A0AAV2ZDM7_9STRA|nr:TPA: hypothetical protein N0F65_011415 [Lagenidium giganteum]